MSQGRSNKLVGQTGEYLVAAEFSRRGLIATTFTGNVPHYDIVASDESGRHVSVQVKASRNGSWQFNISNFCEIEFSGDRQIVQGAKSCPINRLIVVFVKLDEKGNDRYYVLNWTQLRDILIDHHKSYLERQGGVRPKNPTSLHCAISEKSLSEFRDKWDYVGRSLK